MRRLVQNVSSHGQNLHNVNQNYQDTGLRFARTRAESTEPVQQQLLLRIKLDVASDGRRGGFFRTQQTPDIASRRQSELRLQARILQATLFENVNYGSA